MTVQGSRHWQIFPSWVPDTEKQVHSGESWQGCCWDSSFSPFCPSFSHPSMFTGVWIPLGLQTLCCALSLPNCVERSANHRTPGISLSPALLSSLALAPSFPLSLSLSLLLQRFAVLPQSWLVFCNRLNPFLSSEGRYFLLFWLYPPLPVTDILCGAVVILKKVLLRFCTET